MKKTVNKWLLLFASIFLMMTVACSNAAGGGSDSKDDKDKGKGTEQGTDDEPEIQSGEAPEIIEDNDYVGIKIKITAEIPKDAAVREIYVNGKQAGSNGFSTKDDGSIEVSKYVTAKEWGYPFVKAGETYKVHIKYLNKNYQGLMETEPVSVKAKKGLGELKCPNAEHKIEKNILKFTKGSPIVVYGDSNTNIADYPNIVANTTASYILNIYGADWSYQTWNWLGEGADFEYGQDFNFAKHLKADADLTKEYMFNVVCNISDKTYGDYTYFIADTTENKFYINQDYLPKDSLDITQYIPSNDDLKGKVLQDVSKSQYIEFASAEDSKGYLPATMYACSVMTSGSSSGGTTTSYEWHETNFFYKDGKLDFGETSLTLIGDGPGLYCALAPATRVSGEGIYGTFNVWFLNDSVTLSEDGTYSTSGTKGYYEFEDGIIYFKNGLLQDYIAIYDGKTLYISIYFYTTIDKLPDPLPEPVLSGESTVSEMFARKSEVTPQNKDLWGKIFHFTSSSDEGLRDLFF